MLRAKKVTFEVKSGNAKTNVLEINENQIENFPLIGGESAERITIKAVNQHGNTHIISYMEPVESELLFVLITDRLQDFQILEERQKIIDVCNPLNGTVQMKIELSDGSIFFRDVTFLNAPFFPIGFENRNDVWQKVQLQLEANNPFWYSENEIIETFRTSTPSFTFPFSMSPTEKVIFGEIIDSSIATNEGQAEAPIIIKIIGSCINPMIENVTTDEFIKFKDLTMNDTDELTIDTTFGQKKVELNGTNVFNKLDFSTTFFNLAIGENEIEFTDDTVSPTANIYFYYKNLYISI
jgi:hypothetical protein